MAQILLHGILHATIYEVDKLKIGGRNVLTKSIMPSIILHVTVMYEWVFLPGLGEYVRVITFFDIQTTHELT